MCNRKMQKRHCRRAARNAFFHNYKTKSERQVAELGKLQLFVVLLGPVDAPRAAEQQQVVAWIKTYGVRYFSELTNMAVLTEEVGELARIMARKYGDQSFKEGEKCNLADEMADVLWVLLCLANQTGVDLTEAFHRNLEKKTNRDKDRHKNNPKL